jgi:putative oxidoreductase
LRGGVGIALIALGIPGLMGEDPAFVPNIAAAIAGLLLLAGLWTPIAAAFIALDELWIAFSLYSSPPTSTFTGHWIHVFLAVLSAGIAMLGPGAWSIDARLFGRKRFYIGE